MPMRRISCLGLRRILHRGASHQPAHVYEVRDGGVSVSKRFEFRLTIRGSKSGFRRAREGGDCNIGRSEAAHLAVSALPRKGRTDWWQWVAMTATSKRGCESGQLGCNVCKKVHTWKEGGRREGRERPSVRKKRCSNPFVQNRERKAPILRNLPPPSPSLSHLPICARTPSTN